MKELSLNVLDVAKNSVKAGATLITITLIEEGGWLTMTIADNGCGMTPEVLEQVSNPFYTTRTTRKVGMGIPLLTLAAEQTGGTVRITSRHVSAYPDDHGTEVVATFDTTHIDCTPLGDFPVTVQTLIMGSPEIDFVFLHRTDRCTVELDTRQMREILGEEVPLSSYEVLAWILDTLREQYAEGTSV